MLSLWHLVLHTNFHTRKTTHGAVLSQPTAYTQMLAHNRGTQTHTHTQGHLRTSPFKTKPLPFSTALDYKLSFPTKQTRCRVALVVTPANKEWGKATRHRKHAPPWHHCITHRLRPKVCIHLWLGVGWGSTASKPAANVSSDELCLKLNKTQIRVQAIGQQHSPFPGQAKLIWQWWSCHSDWLSRVAWLTAALCLFHPVRMMKMHTSDG